MRQLLPIGIYLILLSLAYTQFNCASRGAPQGGPTDRIPPGIIETVPLPDSTGIAKLDEIELTFSERMDETSVNQSIFVSPALQFTVDWSGWDKVILQVTDTLRAGVTYVVTVGSAAKDLQNNRMKESYQLAFATGSRIDRANISGQVYGISKQDILYIYAYRLKAGDTLNPIIQHADYLSQPAEDGKFLLNYLAAGTYRVFVIEDVNKNLLFDLNFERIGIPARDVTLDSTMNAIENLNFTITKIDTTPPMVGGARALNNRTVVLRCSEVLRSLTADQVLICDSLQTDTLEILALSPNNEDHKQYYLYTAVQPEKTSYNVFVHSIVDSSGNLQPDLQLATFTTSAQIDTTHFNIPRITPPDSISKFLLGSAITLEFSLPVDTVNLVQAFSIQDEQQKKLTGSWVWQDLKKGFFSVDGGFTPGQTYRLHVRTREFRSVWGDTLPDTTITRTLFTLSPDELGSLSGRYTSEKPLPSDVFLDILSVRDRKKVKRVRVNADNTFQADLLAEGYYQLSGFVDLNKDGEYSAGTLFPFRHAEPFYIQTDTIRVRKRWETENIQFMIPGVE